MKWKVVCFLTRSQLCAWCSPLRWWHRLSRFGAPHYRLRWRELVFGSCLPRPTNGRRLAGIGELRESLEDRVAIGHSGCPEGGLYEQTPRAAAPILSVDFPRFGWRRHGGSASVDSCAQIPRSGREFMMFEMRRGRDQSDVRCFARRLPGTPLLPHFTRARGGSAHAGETKADSKPRR